MIFETERAKVTTFQLRYGIKYPRWGNPTLNEDPSSIVAWNERQARRTAHRSTLIDAVKATLRDTHKRHGQYATIKIYLAYKRVNSFGPWELVNDRELKLANMALAREARNTCA